MVQTTEEKPIGGKSAAGNWRILFWLWIIFSIGVNLSFVATALPGLYDFGSFVAAGDFAANGQNPYSVASPLIFSVHFDSVNVAGLAPNLNPPLSVIFFEGLHGRDPVLLAFYVRVISFVAYIVTAFLLSKYYAAAKWMPFWLMSLAGFWHTLQLGQIYVFVFILVVISWILLERNRSIPAGICLGALAAIKPFFVFWIVVLLAGRKRTAFITSSLSLLGLSLLPAIKYGPQIYLQWIEATRLFTAALLPFPGNNSLSGLTVRLGTPSFGMFAGILLAAGTLVYARAGRLPIRRINSLGILVSLLISPLSWTGYTMLASPIMVAKSNWTASAWIAAFILTVPFSVVLELFQKSTFFFVVFGWLYGWGLILLLVDLFKAADTERTKNAKEAALTE